jgi:hypothetical protein
VDYGVTNDGNGNLSGYAWGENVGWINFDPTGGGVTIDADGTFDGWAWGENIGWIHFKNQSIPYSVKTAWAPYTGGGSSSSDNGQDTGGNPGTLVAGEGESIENFILRFYQQALGRTPQQTESDGWVNALLNGDLCGADVAYEFIFSQEFTNRNTLNEEYVTILYRTFFGKDPDPAGYNAWVNHLYNGASREEILNGFIDSLEFENLCARYGINPYEGATIASGGAEDFLIQFYQQCFSREPDQPGLDAWVNALSDGSICGAEVAYGFIFSQEFINQNTSNEDFVTTLYRAFFGREPDTAGYNGWVNYLYAGATRQEALNGFIYSLEFEIFCNSYGIAPYSS